MRIWVLGSECMMDELFVAKCRLMGGFSGYKICMAINLAGSECRVLQGNGVWPFGLVDMGTCGLQYLSIILNWITGIDLPIARASLVILAVPAHQ